MRDIIESKVKIEITGLKKPLRYRLINFHKYLSDGGLVELTFNGNGTYMMIRQVTIDEVKP